MEPSDQGSVADLDSLFENYGPFFGLGGVEKNSEGRVSTPAQVRGTVRKEEDGGYESPRVVMRGGVEFVVILFSRRSFR